MSRQRQRTMSSRWSSAGTSSTRTTFSSNGPGHQQLPYKLGILCCIQCYLHHAQLGKQICRVKNTQKADDWSEDEVQALERAGGNDIMNIIYEAKLDVKSSKFGKTRRLEDKQADALARHSFIRSKYQQLKFFDASVYEFQIKQKSESSSSSSPPRQPRRSSPQEPQLSKRQLLPKNNQLENGSDHVTYNLPANLRIPKPNRRTRSLSAGRLRKTLLRESKDSENASSLASMRTPSVERLRSKSSPIHLSPALNNRQHDEWDWKRRDNGEMDETARQSNQRRFAAGEGQSNKKNNRAPPSMPPRMPNRRTSSSDPNLASLALAKDSAPKKPNHPSCRNSAKQQNGNAKFHSIDLYSPEVKRTKLRSLVDLAKTGTNGTATVIPYFGRKDDNSDTSDTEEPLKQKTGRRGSTGGITTMESPALECFLKTQNNASKHNHHHHHRHHVLQGDDDGSTGTKSTNEYIAGIGPSNVKQQAKKELPPKKHSKDKGATKKHLPAKRHSNGKKGEKKHGHSKHSNEIPYDWSAHNNNRVRSNSLSDLWDISNKSTDDDLDQEQETLEFGSKSVGDFSTITDFTGFSAGTNSSEEEAERALERLARRHQQQKHPTAPETRSTSAAVYNWREVQMESKTDATEATISTSDADLETKLAAVLDDTDTESSVLEVLSANDLGYVSD